MIKRFSFRLERILRHRASIEEMRERELAQVEAQILREREVLGELLSMRGEMLGELAHLQEAPFAGTDRDLYQQYLEWLGSEVTREEGIITELNEMSDKKRTELVKASQDKRIVERLRERRLEEYNAGVARLDQQALDEIASNDFTRDSLGIPGAPLRKRL